MTVGVDEGEAVIVTVLDGWGFVLDGDIFGVLVG
jgi:hypothetical protein